MPQPLATTHQMMTWLSMCPTAESTIHRQKPAYIAYTLVILLLNVIAFATSLTYCLKYFFIDFDGATFAFMVAIGDFGLVYFLIAGILMRQQMVKIFTSLSIIYKISKFNLR